MSRINLEDSILENPIIKGTIKYSLTKLPDAATTLTTEMGPIITMTPTANRILTLPGPVTPDMAGITFTIINNAAFTLTVNHSSGAPTIIVIPATIGASAQVVCTGVSTPGWIASP